jgi:adenylate kinase family enzyme
LCGKNLTKANFRMIFLIKAPKKRASLTLDKFPRTCAYLDLMKNRESYKAVEKKVIVIEGSFKLVF